MEFEEFEKFENDHQNVFDDFKVNFVKTFQTYTFWLLNIEQF